MTRIKPIEIDETGKEFFNTESEARDYLDQEGFEISDMPRYSHVDKTGTVYADIRFNTKGIYIQFRTD